MATREDDQVGDTVQSTKVIVYARRPEDKIDFYITTPKTIRPGKAIQVDVCMSINIAQNLEGLNVELGSLHIKVDRIEPGARTGTNGCVYEYTEDLVQAQAVEWKKSEGRDSTMAENRADKTFVCRGKPLEDATFPANLNISYKLTVCLRLKIMGGNKEVRSGQSVLLIEA